MGLLEKRNSMKVLVTGGLGFIGSHLVDSLINQCYDVTVVDNLSSGAWSNRNAFSRNLIESVVDFCQRENEQYDIIVHLANNARIARSFDFVEETLLNNYNSTVAICEYIRTKSPQARLIFASSSTTEFVDRYNNPYTFSKFVCDDLLNLYAEHFNLNYDIVKFYNAYGSMRESDLGVYTTVIRKFKQQVLEDKPLTIVGDGLQSRDFTFIDDTITALNTIINELEPQQEIYHIGTGQAYSINELAEAFQHPVENVEKRSYEVSKVVCQNRNIPNWVPKTNVLEHIREWRKTNGAS
jgi:UDP-glucose 4-epimerase